MRSIPALALAGMLCAHAAGAAMVTLTVKSKSGAPTTDTIVVLDPLDAVPPAAHETAIIDQVNKTFVPRVNVIRTGTAVSFPNSDRIRHQVYSFSPIHPFTLKLYAGSPRVEVVFDKPGLAVLGCNIHDSMVAFVAVVDSPYFGKIPASGTIDLNLPAGQYRLRAWQPNLTTAVESQHLTVGSGPMTVPLLIDLAPGQTTTVAWPD